MDKTGKKIQKRENPNDVFITPDTLVQEHFELVEPYLKAIEITYPGNTLVLDPCSHGGRAEPRKYYDKFKENKYDVDWCEITKGRDFFEYQGRCGEDLPDAIVGNPPYSLIDAFLDKSISLNPKIISYLIGFSNITTKRLEKMEKAGYTCVEFHLTKVFKWYGMSLLIVWVKDHDGKSVVGYDRKVHR